MKILYENKNLIICEKPVGILSEHSPSLDGLADEVERAYGYAGIINRLDRGVGGAVLFGKSKKETAYLNNISSNNGIHKEYTAVINGTPQAPEGTYRDLLFKDSSKNKSFVVKRMRKGVKEALLDYKLVSSVNLCDSIYSLVQISLQTGRTHQIRVQFSSRNMPLVGDGKYGGGDNKCGISLWCSKMSFELSNKKQISISSYPDLREYPWNLFDDFRV